MRKSSCSNADMKKKKKKLTSNALIMSGFNGVARRISNKDWAASPETTYIFNFSLAMMMYLTWCSVLFLNISIENTIKCQLRYKFFFDTSINCLVLPNVSIGASRVQISIFQLLKKKGRKFLVINNNC